MSKKTKHELAQKIVLESPGGFFKSPTYRLEQNQVIPRPIDEVFEFFGDAFNLEVITPEFLNFNVLTPAPIDIQTGTLIEYKIRLFGVPMKWRTLIETFEPTERFVDTQLKGPYALWHHTHEFVAHPDGTLMTDIVRYQVGWGLLGRAAHTLFVKSTLKRIFTHRFHAIGELLRQGVSSSIAPVTHQANGIGSYASTMNQ